MPQLCDFLPRDLSPYHLPVLDTLTCPHKTHHTRHIADTDRRSITFISHFVLSSIPRRRAARGNNKQRSRHTRQNPHAMPCHALMDELMDVRRDAQSIHPIVGQVGHCCYLDEWMGERTSVCRNLDWTLSAGPDGG